jgi:hypothetical protein
LYFGKVPNFMRDNYKFLSNNYSYQFDSFKIKRFFCCKKSSKQRKTEAKLNKDLDILNLIDTVYKMKASLEVLVNDNAKQLLQIKKRYFIAKTVSSDSSDDPGNSTQGRGAGMPASTASPYMRFLEDDQMHLMDHRFQKLQLKQRVMNILQRQVKRSNKRVSGSHGSIPNYNDLLIKDFNI